MTSSSDSSLRRKDSVTQPESTATSGKLTKCIIYSTVITNIGSFLYGYDAGIISGSMIFIKKQFSLSTMETEFTVSIVLAAAWIFSMTGGSLANFLGRKRAILISAGTYVLASILMASAPDKYSLMLGRFINGAAIGLSSSTVPLYVAESSSTNLRGPLVVLSFMFIVAGQLAAAIIAGGLSYSKSWRIMLGLAVIPSVIHFVGTFFIPESPRFLIEKKKGLEAMQSLQSLRGTPNVDIEYNAIRIATEEVENEKSDYITLFKEVLSKKCLRRALMIGILLQVFKQTTGITPIIYYTASIIEMSGVHEVTNAIWWSAAVNLVFVICSAVGSYLVEKMGRRPLMLVSMAGVFVGLVIVSTGFYLARTNSPAVDNYGQNDLKGTLHCSQYANCFGCAYDKQCGYCYHAKGNGQRVGTISGECLPVSRLMQSAMGDCVNGTLLDHETGKGYDVVWANGWCPSDYSWIVLFGLVFFLFFYGPGVGPIPFTCNCEIFPLKFRSVCFSITVGFAWFFNILMTSTFLSTSEMITQAGAFTMYAILTFGGFVILYIFLPETKGISLEEMDKIFLTAEERRKSASSSSAGNNKTIVDNCNYNTINLNGNNHNSRHNNVI